MNPVEENLRKQVHWLKDAGCSSSAGVEIYTYLQAADEIARLEAENARLKAGKLNPEEFLTLCHNLHESGSPYTREEFARGCEIFQVILFGPKCGEDKANG